MGLYPDFSSKPANTHYVQAWVEFREDPGVTWHRTVTASPWSEYTRTDCYCCSCNDWYLSTDCYCRNHGWYGRRPCEVHEMPGEAGDDGSMPESVQVEVQRQKDQVPR